ncbi:MAG: Single-stranded DNA-binding protein [Mycoplasmataceae bacterium]|nr:MAG: Single-stranded DNA-binding protein [Mycoplasmataceae bacterium]
MLNKINVIGKILINNEKKSDNLYNSESINDRENNKEPWLYFSLLVSTPSDSITILRCMAQGELVKKIEDSKENDIVEVKGYLRNEKDGRQIIIKVVEFDKLDLSAEEISKKNPNQVRLLGKIITDLQDSENQRKSDVLSFKLSVPREGVKLPLFFCRVHGKLISEINDRLKKGDIILLEGFLQTKKVEEMIDGEKRFSRISSIICEGFTFLDNDSVNYFSPLENLTRVFENTKKIDFTKPKTN